MPILNKKCQHKADQEEIKKVEHYRKQASGKDFPLVNGKRCLLIEQLQHDFLLFDFDLLCSPSSVNEAAGFCRSVQNTPIGACGQSARLCAAGAGRYDRAMPSDPPPRFHYRLGLNQPIGSPTQKRLAEMAEAIGRETLGAFRLEVFPESRLGPDPQMLADLRGGALEFFVAGATLGELAPTSALPLLPFAFADSKAVFAALDGGLGERIRGELAQNGVHAFRHCLQNGFHHLTTSTRPIQTAGDLAGVKIRSPGGAIARDFFATFGAEAGYVPFNQMYDALKERRFDGQSDPLGVVLSLKLYEVQSHLSLTGHWWSGFTLHRQCRRLGRAAGGDSAGRRGQCREVRIAAAPGHRGDQRRRGRGAGAPRHDRQHRRHRQLSQLARPVLRALARARRPRRVAAARNLCRRGRGLEVSFAGRRCFSLSAPGGGEGWGEVGETTAPAGAHLTLPSLRDGPLPLPPKGGEGSVRRRQQDA